MTSLDQMFDQVSRATLSRRRFLAGMAAMSAFPHRARASSGKRARRAGILAYLEHGQTLYEPQDIRTTCLDPRHIGARSISGADVCLLTAGHALGTWLGTQSIYANLLSRQAIMTAACEIVGGEANFCRHTDAIHVRNGGSIKDVDGCLYCRMWRKDPLAFLMSERRRDDLHADLVALSSDSQLYDGEVHPFAFLTVRQLGYVPGDHAWGVDGTITLPDGSHRQLYVDHQTLGVAHLTNYARHLWRIEPALASRMSEDECVQKIVTLWKLQTGTIIRIKREHHENIPHVFVTFRPDGSLHELTS